MTSALDLTPSGAALLRDIVNARSPELSALLDVVGERLLTFDEREALRLALALEVLDNEWDAVDDMPTERGALIESVIDALLYY